MAIQESAQPSDVGPVSLGSGMWLDTGRPGIPGALALTWIEASSEEERAEVDELADRVVEELLQEPGILSLASITAGRRQYTITSWVGPESVRSLRRQAPHRQAVRRVFQRRGLGASVMTSVWVPWRVEGVLSRCPACGAMSRASGPTPACRCGTALATSTPYV